MRQLIRGVFFVVLACGGGTPQEPVLPGERVTVVVRVVFSDQVPVEGTSVHLDPGNRIAITDEQGVARFPDTPAGFIGITVRPEGEAAVFSGWDLTEEFPSPIPIVLPLPPVSRLDIAWDGRVVEWGAPESLRVDIQGIAAGRVRWFSLDDSYHGEAVELARGPAAPTSALRPGNTRVEARYVFAGRVLARASVEVVVRYRDRWNVELEGFLPYPPGTALDLWAAGSIAYLARGSAGGISVVDLGGGGPTEIGRYTAPGLVTPDVKVQGDVAFIANEGFAYAFHLALLDVSDPREPRPFTGLPGCCTHNITVEDSILVVVDRSGGDVRTVDLTDIRDPRIRRLVGSGHDAQLREGLLYIATPTQGTLEGRITIVDVSNPADPVSLSETPLGGLEPAAVWRSPDSRHLYVVSEEVNAPVLILDVTDPGGPFLIGSYRPRLGAAPHLLRIQDRTALLSLGAHGVEVMDVSNPAVPRLVGFFDTSPGEFGSGGLAASDEVTDAHGAWGVHWTSDGRWIASDADQGLFVLRQHR
jgi:hypothetical protein